ncbi:spore cortex biosynthesis protein YabQ [Bacillus mycoides]|uniref:Spore cortex biosynthesis protein YabQ n=3 Tax=Bacillus cereus group TaxID=86661 RepID=A0A1D3MFG2_BACMY|nr:MULTISPECIES: spore cortex biosynthesis protein YabQ [Bacillus]EJQ36127.1 spore cortex biosynthesis protein YabQ [Bacillus cereus BAG5X1-1]EJV62879.1 spore cortex biosynthesis protein YabQ [Bacillus cereus BAG6O-2]MBJ8009080.1 spore cortex biosynthesis protein YabQ [Bacillus cereus]MBJ8054759.1 spore cortex biosynthesis protein YabQ [Bacillus cereus]MBJ8073079.1 spore cortex biosynthesis protein YabQ [Bacillus cereus]
MSLTIQLYTMLSMIGMGAWIGASLDTYQRFLKRQERKRWLVFIQDILFWIVQALFVFYVLLRVNEAELRIYVFLALLCGFAAYQSLLKALYMKMLNFLIYIFVQTTQFFVRIIQLLMIKPVIIIAQLFIAFILFLFRILLSIGHVLWKMVIWILLFIWKVFFSPVRFIASLIWKLLPNRVKLFIMKHVGFLQYVAKLKGHIFQLWERIKKKLGGPRK